MVRILSALKKLKGAPILEEVIRAWTPERETAEMWGSHTYGQETQGQKTRDSPRFSHSLSLDEVALLAARRDWHEPVHM